MKIQTLSADTLPRLLQARARHSPNTTAYCWRDSKGDWVSENWKDYYRHVNELALGFRDLGVKAGDVVGILAPTCLEWELSQMAILAVGGTVVGLDPYELPEYLQQAVNAANISHIIVDSKKRLVAFKGELNRYFRLVVEFSPEDTTVNTRGMVSLDCLREKGAFAGKDIFEGSYSSRAPATIVFTSGTTGTPKGIVYSHEQLLFAANEILEAYSDIDPGSRLACWLPLSNLFQRMVNICAIGRGATTYFVKDPRRVMDDLPSIHPHIFIAVPRFFEKLYASFERELRRQAIPLRIAINYILEKAQISNNEEREKRYSRLLARAIARRLSRKLRAMFGSNLKYFISGSAPMPVWLLQRLDALGLRVFEAYGMSENVVPVAANRPGGFRFGSVGKVLSGNRVKLAEDGELLIKGKGLFSGYLDDCSIGLDEEGFLATGDLAEFDKDGFLILKGRKSELFKTSTGKKIAPVEIEECLKRVNSVEQAAVFGSGRKYPIGIVTVVSRRDGENSDKGEMERWVCDMENLRNEIGNEIKQLAVYKRPVGLIISPRIFSLESKELTSNMKLRRKKIEENHHRALERLYRELEYPDSSIYRGAVSLDDGVMLIKV